MVDLSELKIIPNVRFEMLIMSVFYSLIKGRPTNVLSSVKRRISAFTRSCNIYRFKIGITSSPERRWKESYQGVYDEMLVLYESSSINSVSSLEYDLVNHNRGYCDNLIAGGGGGIAARSPYYLYIVIKY